MTELLEGNMAGTSNPEPLSTKRQRIAQLAKDCPGMGFTSLNQLLTLEALRESYARLRKEAAPGVDGQTAAAYAANLESNLQSLLNRAHNGSYRAPPVRRTYILKPGTAGETRPLGVPTFEDKVLQRAVATILEVVYEQDFLECSYGYRPGRSAHQALETLRNGIMDERGVWLLEVDIRRFFDTLDHARLRDCRTSSCTTCWTNGSYKRCSPDCRAGRVCCATRTTSWCCSLTKRMRGDSWKYCPNGSRSSA